MDLQQRIERLERANLTNVLERLEKLEEHNEKLARQNRWLKRVATVGFSLALMVLFVGHLHPVQALQNMRKEPLVVKERLILEDAKGNIRMVLSANEDGASMQLRDKQENVHVSIYTDAKGAAVYLNEIGGPVAQLSLIQGKPALQLRRGKSKFPNVLLEAEKNRTVLELQTEAASAIRASVADTGAELSLAGEDKQSHGGISISQASQTVFLLNSAGMKGRLDLTKEKAELALSEHTGSEARLAQWNKGPDRKYSELRLEDDFARKPRASITSTTAGTALRLFDEKGKLFFQQPP